MRSVEIYDIIWFTEVKMNAELRLILSDLQHLLKNLYNSRLSKIILYGSQARHDAEAGSDIDVLVVLNGAVNPGDEIVRTSKLISDLSLKYNTLISCAFVSSDRYLKEKSPLLLNVRREGVAV